MGGTLRRIMVVFGTRPEAIKMAPVIMALQAHPNYRAVVTITAQHRSILDQVLDLFGIVPDHDLDILQPGQSLTDVTVRALRGLSPVIGEAAPDAVLVQGDTTTTFVGALAAFYHQVPVVHLEAGLRSGDPFSPYPEEINRRLTSQLATLHLPPTRTAAAALTREGTTPERIIVTGNTVIDALQWVVEQEPPWTNAVPAEVVSDPRRMVLVTAHRRESWGPGMRSIGQALAQLATDDPEILIVFPIHPNPLVRDAIVPQVAHLENVRILEPLPYGDFARLMARADVILTDSGGVQEEGPSLGKPVLVMRETTERPEAIEAGTARLVGTDAHAIVDGVRRLLDDADAYAAMANAVNPYGDGRAAARTVEALAHLLDGRPRPEEFASATNRS